MLKDPISHNSSLDCGLFTAGIVAENRGKPTLYIGNAHPFSRGVRLYLIFTDGAHCEVVRFFMSKIEAANRCGGEHGVTLRESNARGFLYLKQIE